ncbi:hypothetical protein ACFXGO_16115 [Streptomyces roseus]|uniref:hypothetical protein n=1 Tax=Streptomyces roseus TaxID=66430 RepID=UPI0036A4D470
MGSFTRSELARHDWRSMECGCERTAEHLSQVLQSVADGQPDTVGALDNHAFIQSNLMEPAPAVVAVAMAMLVDAPSESALSDAVWILWCVAECEGDVDSDEPTLFSESVVQIRQGIWSLYGELMRAQDELTVERLLDILRVAETHPERLRDYRELLGL